jgi:lipoate-protein ligase A
MAVDEALLRLVKEPVLRIYAWDRPAVSIGYFQKAAVVPEGRPFVRRYTGGGLVDHARDVTYTLVAPREAPLAALTLAESYSRVHEAVKMALEKSGFRPVLSENCEPEAEACFNRAVRYDVTLDGKKVAGGAQRRTREGLLHQGSILLPDPAGNEILRRNLPGALAEILGWELRKDALLLMEEERAGQLQVERYGTEEWNRQR